MARLSALAASALLLGGVLVLGTLEPAAAGSAAITSCDALITTPGTYVLVNDLTCPGTAITVQANKVRLLLGSHTLTGPDSFSGVGVFAQGVSGLQIVGAGGAITKFLDGIFLDGTPGARVTGVVARGNTDTGIEAVDCAGCQFVSNRADRNGYGIYTDGCAECRFVNNQANDNGSGGISAVGSSPRILVAGNTANGNEDGIDLEHPEVDGGRIQGNTTNNNWDNGIDLFEGAAGNRIEGNRATGNGHPDLYDGNLPNCVNTWRGNTFVTDNEADTADGPRAGCIR